MKKYPSIERFRNIIKDIRTKHDYVGKDEEGNTLLKHSSPYPVLNFKGTIKLHGTNASIVKYANGELKYQSRERVLSIGGDNNGFMNAMVGIDTSKLFDGFVFNDYCAIYGEWCGGSIQKGVAINGLPKMFVIFGVKLDDGWIELSSDIHDKSNNIYNILQFPTYEIEIDFNKPELSQDKLNEMTIKVETECPVGKFFGKIGIGEGIVFTCIENQDIKFKSKGEKHSVTNDKKPNSTDIGLMNSINEFVESVITENRLEQGLSHFTENNIEIDNKNIGTFLKWIIGDVLKEELETITLNNLHEYGIKQAITKKAKSWFFNKTKED